MSYQPNGNGGSQRERATLDRGFNINSVFLTILLTMSGWTLLKVVSLSEANVASTSSISAQNAATVELRARMVSAEVQLQANTIAITRLQARLP